jgi:hypothetical protein
MSRRSAPEWRCDANMGAVGYVSSLLRSNGEGDHAKRGGGVEVSDTIPAVRYASVTARRPAALPPHSLREQEAERP